MINIIAHRGLSSLHIDNTLPAFREAVNLGVDFIELDIQATQDGRLLCFHDNEIEGKLIAATPYQDLKVPPFVPELKNVLRQLRGACGMMIEIKNEAWNRKKLASAKKLQEHAQLLVSQILKELAAYLEKYREKAEKEGPIYMASFCPDVVATLKRQNWPLERIIGIAATQERINEHLAEGVSHLALKSILVDKESFLDLKKRGVKVVWTWTVDQEEEAARVHEIGVDGIITNYPQKIIPMFKS